MTTRTPAAALLVALTLAACASDSLPDRNDPPPPAIQPSEEMRSRAEAIFPPANWWHLDTFRSVALQGDQEKRLDALQDDQGAEIARLERDQMLAVRDVRTALDVAQPADDQIATANEHLRQLRDSLVARQLAMLAAERRILTIEQWRALEDAIAAQSRRRPGADGRGQRPGGMGGRGGRGRGGMGGGGRWPGGGF